FFPARLWRMRWGVLAVVLLTAGCVPGSRGVASDWPAMPAPQAFIPAADTCHAAVLNTVSVRNYQPVDCAQQHLVQTVHVGRLTGAIADLPKPPALDEETAEPAYAECDK